MANEQATTGQTDTAPATPQPATDAGTAPVVSGQPQQTDSASAPAAGVEQAPAAVVAATTQTAPVVKAPAEYADFSLSDGYALDPELGGEFKAIAKELDLTQDQAQRLVDFDAKRVQAHAKAQTDELHKNTAAWQEAAKTDAEFGGANLDASIAIASKALDTFGTPALKELLGKMGLGNHPEVIRAFYRAGKAISEDSFVSGAAPAAPADPAKRLFPNQA